MATMSTDWWLSIKHWLGSTDEIAFCYVAQLAIYFRQVPCFGLLKWLELQMCTTMPYYYFNWAPVVVKVLACARCLPGKETYTQPGASQVVQSQWWNRTSWRNSRDWARRAVSTCWELLTFPPLNADLFCVWKGICGTLWRLGPREREGRGSVWRLWRTIGCRKVVEGRAGTYCVGIIIKVKWWFRNGKWEREAPIGG